MTYRVVHTLKHTIYGNVPSNWEIKKISDLDQNKDCVQTGPFGSLLHSYDYQATGHPLILVKHVKNGKILKENLPKIGNKKYLTLRKFILNEGDIVFTRVGYVGESGYVEKENAGWLISGQMLRIRLNNSNVNNRFLAFLFLTERFQRLAQSVVLGSTRDSINTQILKDMPIILPSRQEQDKIVSIIHPIHLLIDNLKNQNRILEKMIQSIFKSWLIDFDGQTEFVDSELGEIPKGWKVIPIGNAAQFVRGFSYKGSEKFYEPRGFMFVTLNNIKEGGGFKKEYAWLDSDRIKERHYVNEMDLIIANTEQTKDARLLTTPALVIFPFNYKRNLAVFSHHITKIKPKFHNLKFYIYSLFLYKQQEIANAYHTGTGVWGFDHNSFQEQFKIIHPTENVLNKFNELGFLLHSKLIQNEKIISILKITRDSLLPKLMSGEIRV